MLQSEIYVFEADKKIQGFVGLNDIRWHTTPRQVAFALDVLERLARRYRDRPALYGIEVLNEPVDRLTHLMPSVFRSVQSTLFVLRNLRKSFS